MQKTKIKAIFFDFDWTLFDHKSRDFIAKSNEAINKAQEKGINLIINSARSYYSLKGLKTFDLIKFNGFVLNNGGAAIYNNKVLYANYLKSNKLKKIVEFCEEKGLSYLFVTLKDSYLKVNNKANVDEFYSFFYEPYPLDFSEYKDEPLVALQIFAKDEYDEELKKLCLDEGIIFNRFDTSNIEITSKEFTKKDGINAILKELNISKDETMAFGDDLNDIDMFNAVKYSVAMGNGKQELKDIAYYVTDNIEDAGIYKALKHFKIID